jgi:hypothetical protein
VVQAVALEVVRLAAVVVMVLVLLHLSPSYKLPLLIVVVWQQRYKQRLRHSLKPIYQPTVALPVRQKAMKTVVTKEALRELLLHAARLVVLRVVWVVASMVCPRVSSTKSGH